MKFSRKSANPLIAAVLTVLLCMTCAMSGCRATGSINTSLSDLGGVYASRFSDLDLKNEISGRLSEDKEDPELRASWMPKADSDDADISDQAAVSEGTLSNKVLRWGISRRQENKTPAADPGAPELLSKYGGMWLGDTGKSVIYLTFDEGYENGYTPAILDTLAENNVKAVFFITGPYLKEHQDLVRRMLEEGHVVGNHTIHHPSLPELSDSQLEEEVLGLDRAFREKFGQSMVFLRPPKGEYSERTLALTQKLGYCNLFWSFAYDDWYRDKSRGSQYAYDIVMRNLHNGAVLLLHAVSKDNAQALDSIIKGAREKGYTIGDPQDLLQPLKAGDE